MMIMINEPILQYIDLFRFCNSLGKSLSNICNN